MIEKKPCNENDIELLGPIPTVTKSINEPTYVIGKHNGNIDTLLNILVKHVNILNFRYQYNTHIVFLDDEYCLLTHTLNMMYPQRIHIVKSSIVINKRIYCSFNMRESVCNNEKELFKYY